MAFAIIFSAATSSSSIVSAFHYSAISPLSSANAAASHRSLFFQLDATASSNNNHNLSELDKLRAKRLSLRRPSSPPPSLASPVNDQPQQRGLLEYLYDQNQERHDDDFFHVILMPSTFTKNQVSIEHSTTTLLTALSNNNNQLTYEKAHSLSLFAKHQGFSVIGTWTREDCLLIGDMLVKEGLDCRVIPFNSALPSSSLEEEVVVPPSSSSSSLVMSGQVVREESHVEVGESTPVVTVRSSASYSSDYLLSLSP